MNSILYNPADIELDVLYDSRGDGESPLLEDRFATAPMVVVRAPFQQDDEEELHTSFEQAISDRVLVVNRQLSRLSGRLSDTPYVQPQTDAVMRQDGVTELPALHGSLWQRGLMLACLCLMLLMLGFDLMGILLLYSVR